MKLESSLCIFNVNKTLDILKSLDTSKATGPDGISCKMLKETADSIAPSFTRLLQLSISLYLLLKFQVTGSKQTCCQYLRRRSV